MIEKVEILETVNPEKCKDEKVLLNNIRFHQDNVNNVMIMLSNHMKDIGNVHDWTKLDYFDEFAKDCIERKDNHVFKNREWYNIHCEFERHHLNSKVPDDVDLFDVIESIVDCIVTAKSQKVSINPFFLLLRDDLLQKAYKNTIYKIDDNILLKE